MRLQQDAAPPLELDAHTLRIVRALVEHGSITAAAGALGFSQPAVSQHLRRAEARIGMPLIARSGRGVRLTEAGRVLARHARTITTALDAAAGELAELSGLRAGRVRLAAFPTASSTLVPQVLRRLQATHPGIGVGYLEAEPPEAVEAVRSQQADLAITFGYPGDRVDPHAEGARGLVVVPLWRDEMMLALPGGIGTLSEVALAWSLMQTGEMAERPLVLLGQTWRETIRVYAQAEYIRARDMDLIYLANSAETATGYIKQRLAARL